MDTEVRAFEVSISEEVLEGLRVRLDLTRWPDELPGVGWDYGVPLGYVRDLAGYWRDGYDWREQEARLNEFPQFTTTIDGQNVHFLHVRSPEPNTLPLEMADVWEPAERSPVPMGVAVFPSDPSVRRFVEREHEVVHWSEFERGGHFAAMEAPDLLVGDVRAFFRRFR